ncbi:MAG: hypothetical protein ACR2IS_17175 [Nitrososphaeraceae archaeon]
MNKVKSSLLAAAILGTIIALVIVPTTLMSSEEQGKRTAEAMAFILPLTDLYGS